MPDLHEHSDGTFHARSAGMKRPRPSLVVAGTIFLAGALFAGGCWLGSPWHHEPGYALLHWNLGGRTDASACAERGVASVQVLVIDGLGETRAIARPRCDAFQEAVVVEEGWYHAYVTMVGASGAFVADTVTTEEFAVAAHEAVDVNVSFPGCAAVAVNPVPPGFCADGTAIARRDQAGCVTGYDCDPGGVGGAGRVGPPDVGVVDLEPSSLSRGLGAEDPRTAVATPRESVASP